MGDPFSTKPSSMQIFPSLKNLWRVLETAEKLRNQVYSKMRDGATSRAQAGPMKRDWPMRLGKLLLFSVVLGIGLLVGVVGSLHMSRYIGGAKAGFFQSSALPCVKQNGQHRIREFLWGNFPYLHNMTDEELLWMASMVPRRLGTPIHRVPKVAFMFLTKGPLPLGPLWDRFFKGHEQRYSIYVHTLPEFTLQVPKSSAFYGRQIPSQETNWGDITMCDAERRLLANALLDYSNKRFLLLSESCIPLYNFSTFYKYVLESKHSFVGSFDDPGPYGRGRYNGNMEPEVTVDQWRKGAQWFEVNRKLAVFIVADNLYYPKFRDYCRPACYVDEHYLPSMLTKEFGNVLANRSLTAVDWSRGGSHPAMFGKDDITEEFIQRFRQDKNCLYNGERGHICYFFARKFSPNALEPLLALSDKVLNLH